MTTTESLPQILLLTHGGWGQQLCNSLRMVMGEIKGVTEIALMPVDTLGEFYQRVEAVVKTMPEGSLILTDFIGGCYFRAQRLFAAGGARQTRAWPVDHLRG